MILDYFSDEPVGTIVEGDVRIKFEENRPHITTSRAHKCIKV